MTEAQRECMRIAQEHERQADTKRKRAADMYVACEYSGMTLGGNDECKGSDCECYVHGPQCDRLIEQADALQEKAAEWRRWAQDPVAAERAVPRQQLGLWGAA